MNDYLTHYDRVFGDLSEQGVTSQQWAKAFEQMKADDVVLENALKHGMTNTEYIRLHMSMDSSRRCRGLINL